jgi:hypothetical protein
MDGILDSMDCPPAVRAQLEAAFRTMLSDPSAAAGRMQEILAMMGANAQQSPEEMLASVDVDTDSRYCRMNRKYFVVVINARHYFLSALCPSCLASLFFLLLSALLPALAAWPHFALCSSALFCSLQKQLAGESRGEIRSRAER